MFRVRHWSTTAGMPVDLPVLLAFIAMALALVLSPGPDTMLILRYTIGSGQRVGLATVAGVQAGLAVHTFAAAIGLSLLVATTPAALKAIAAAGAVYLAWLGLQSLRAGTVEAGDDTVRVGAGKACRDAMVTNLLNPKVLLLFLALMPQFVVPGRSPVVLQLAFLGAVLIAVNTVWQTTLAIAAERIRPWLVRATVQRAVAIIAGGVFLLFSLLLVIDYLL